jgi:hypothetical protein
LPLLLSVLAHTSRPVRMISRSWLEAGHCGATCGGSGTGAAAPTPPPVPSAAAIAMTSGTQTAAPRITPPEP